MELERSGGPALAKRATIARRGRLVACVPILPSLADRVERAAEGIRKLARATSLARAVAIGGAIVEHMYDGDLTKWRHRGRKPASLQKLASRPGVGMSESELYRSLVAYEITVGARVSKWKLLSLAHIRSLLSADPSARVGLAVACEQEGWSVKRLSAECEKQRHRRKPGTNRGGRPRKPVVLRYLARAKDEVERAIAEPLEPAAIDRARELLQELRAAADEVEARLIGDRTTPGRVD